MSQNEGKWMFYKDYDGNWSNGDSDYYDTKEEAITQGFDTYPREDYDKFYVGQVESANTSIKIYADNILEQVADHVYDDVGEVAEDYLNYVKQEDKNILEELLNRTLINWMNEYGYNPSFFKIVNTERIEIL